MRMMYCIGFPWCASAQRRGSCEGRKSRSPIDSPPVLRRSFSNLGLPLARPSRQSLARVRILRHLGQLRESTLEVPPLNGVSYELQRALQGPLRATNVTFSCPQLSLGDRKKVIALELPRFLERFESAQ